MLNARVSLSALALLALLGACRTPPPPPPAEPAPPAAAEPLTWGRKDCKRAAGNVAIQDQFARDKAFCEQDAQIIPGDGVNNAMVRCMDRRGYNYSTRDNHDAYCAARTTRR